ncbi:MAG: hypothetical protein MI749_14815, partial [Desulfovibrionales bacterium]|nr:hypothetical protein [Desulfovibrionales bacterium]
MTKNGQFEIKTGQAKGRFKLFRVIPGLAKMVTLRQQQRLIKELTQISPQTRIPLGERKAVTTEVARNFLLNVKGQEASKASSTAPPLPSRSETNILDQLYQLTKGGDESGLLQKTLNQTEDLAFVQTLETKLSPIKKDLAADPHSQTSKNYTDVKLRAAQLTGIEQAKQLLQQDVPDPQQSIRESLEQAKFSGRKEFNIRLQNEAIATALDYLAQHSKPAPTDALADYYLKDLGETVDNVTEFRAKFAQGLQQLQGRARIPEADIEQAAKDLQYDGVPDLPAARDIARSILAEKATAADPEQWNLKRYNEIAAFTKEITADIENTSVAGSRFRNIKSPSHSNVPIHVPGKYDDQPVKGQVHANYISGTGKHSAIATQYPANTEQGKAAFWRMALQNSSNMIVDLTQKKDVLNRPGSKPETPY